VRSRVVASGVLLAVSLVAVACELLLPTHADDGAPVASPLDTCAHVLPPPPPEGGAGGGSTVAISAVKNFAFADIRSDAGYDLDGVCTCETDARSCVPTDDAGKEYCDQSGGRDLQGNGVLSAALDLALHTSGFGDIDSRIGQGAAGYLVVLRDYNDGANDDQVYASFINSSGDLYQDDAGRLIPQPPNWDGDDAWAVDCNLNVALCPPPDKGNWLGDSSITSGFFDPAAYVTDHVLVAHPKRMVVQIANTSLEVTDAIVTAKLTPAPSGSGYQMDGEIAGRITTHNIWVMLSTVHVTLPDGGTDLLCGDNPYLEGYRPQLCTSTDLSASAASDRTNAFCDALSVSIPFTAFPAKIGYHFDRTPLVPGCAGRIVECPR
jgi:hypothetical protein